MGGFWGFCGLWATQKAPHVAGQPCPSPQRRVLLEQSPPEIAKQSQGAANGAEAGEEEEGAGWLPALAQQ